MAADPIQIMRILDLRGIDLRLVAGTLMARARTGTMPPDMADFVRHYKPLIVVELRERERLAETVANAMALDDVEYGQWAAEIRAAPADDANLDHDREALGQARRLKELTHRAAKDQEAA